MSNYIEKLFAEENKKNPYVVKSKQKENEIKQRQKDKIEHKFKLVDAPEKKTKKVNYNKYEVSPKLFDLMTSTQIEEYMIEQRRLIEERIK